MTSQGGTPISSALIASYKNARRLTSTETNIAYLTADHLRYQQLDFVVGIEVHLSGNHTLNGKKFHDICDELQGKYPKDFKFTGWHPQCRCYATSILKTPEEIAEDNRRLLRGEPVSDDSVNAVRDVPPAFKQWLADNAERIASAKSLPYFLRDNGSMQDGAYQLNDFGTAQSGAVEPNAEQLNAAMIDKLQEQAQNGFLPKEAVEKLQQIATNGTQAEFDSRAALLQAVAERHASRTGKQIADIEQRWEERKDFNTARSQAEQLTHLAQGTNIDTSDLTQAMQQRDTAQIKLLAAQVKQKLEYIKLAADNVINVAKNYTDIDTSPLNALLNADKLDYVALRQATRKLAHDILAHKKAAQQLSDTEIKDKMIALFARNGKTLRAGDITVQDGAVNLTPSQYDDLSDWADITPQEKNLIRNHRSGSVRCRYIGTPNSFTINGALRDIGGGGAHAIHGEVRGNPECFESYR